MDTDSEPGAWKYFPFELGECEDLENYEPGGFHPVHLDDVYDGQYQVAHKLGFGGFSTVWLARHMPQNAWVALKIVAARESQTYEARSVIASHPCVIGSHQFAMVNRQFWIDGLNGRHLCLVFPVLGPDLSKLSKGIYSRLKPAFARNVSLQAVRALAHLHLNGLCHGDFTASNMALRITNEFHSYGKDDLVRLYGRPQTAPMRTYSGKPPRPHAPDYIVVPLDFCSSHTNIFSGEICIIDFDQSFAAITPPPKAPGIPAKYLAPEVAVGLPASPAADVWALGCAIFRMRSGDDLFFDYDTDCPSDALRQIVMAIGDLPEKWRLTKFHEGFAVGDEEEGEPFWTFEETRPLDGRVRGIVDEPPGMFINSQGKTLEAVEEPDPPMFESDAAFRVPYPAALSYMVWKPTAVCVDGGYFTAYSDETHIMLEAFPKIPVAEVTLLIDLLSKIFKYDPATRIKAEDLLTHPWFQIAVDNRGKGLVEGGPPSSSFGPFQTQAN